MKLSMILGAAALVAGAAALGASDLPRLYAKTLLAIGKPSAADIAELSLERTIPLGYVKGRIDHLAVDLARNRVFVAELGNGSVGVIDLTKGKVVKRLEGLHEPQGVAYAAAQDRLFVADGGDGNVRVYDGGDLAPTGEVALGDDADNVRIDGQGRVLVGYGAGAIAVLDPATLKRLGDWPLAAHPESFQLSPDRRRLFVNEPNALRVGVIDAENGKDLGHWGVTCVAANFPMALDERKLFVAYRMPAVLAAFDLATGVLSGRAETCRDADDVFADAKRRRLYVICGEGAVDVLDAETLADLGRLQTRSGARTGLFVADLDLLLVAVPAREGGPAELRLYRPR